jgi:hypothetical protein
LKVKKAKWISTGSSAGAFAAVAGSVPVAAGAPHAESSMDIKTSRLAKDHSIDFLFISLFPFWLNVDSMCGVESFLFFYVIAPFTNLSMMWLWSIRNTTTTGNRESTIPAISDAKPTLYVLKKLWWKTG